MASNVLVLGASGRFGRHAAKSFAAAGWQVHRFDRNRHDLTEMAKDADVIVNAWNPPYPQWAGQVPDLTRQVIAAAKINDATVIIPGNVYVFGENAPDVFDAETAHGAQNPLGRVRIEMERAYRDAGVKTIILRAGDFLDTEASGNWFDQIIAAKTAKGRFSYPGDLDQSHAWAFLPDMARAAVQLAEMRGGLHRFEDVPFPGITLTGRALGQAINAVHPVKVTQMSWLPLRMLSPFWPMARHLLEMQYLWNKPHQIDPTRFNQLLPTFPHTAVDEVIRQALHPLIPTKLG